MNARSKQPVSLNRDLGMWSAIALVIGTVIGSGIFIVPNTMARNMGSPDMVFLVWVVGGLMSLSGALTYAELSAAMPGAGGEYVYLREAYGPVWSFIYGWTQMWVAKSGSIATLATAFFLYLANFHPELKQPVGAIPVPLGPSGGPLEINLGQILAMVLIMGLGVLNYFGVRLAGNVQVLVTICKVGLIFAVIAIGLGTGHGASSNFGSKVVSTLGNPGSAFFAALVAALWAYDGWNNVSMVASEIRDPQRNLPRALIGGTAAVMGIYLLANAAYFYVLPASEVAASDLVAAEMMRRIYGQTGAGLVSVAAMISIFAALNGSILSGSRVPYAMARDGLFFAPMSRVHPDYHTPGISILALSGWAAILVLSGRYDQLFTYVIFASWILYGMTTAAVIVLRRKRPDMARPYRTFGYPWVPIVFVISALSLIVSTLVNSPRESMMGIVLVLIGLPFYYYWSKRRT
ncbi:MAG TPA: amino acid permease [Bryobacteraceae bacterium]|nr:amino acid permease [Bryobacteraceae bacterium]